MGEDCEYNNPEVNFVPVIMRAIMLMGLLAFVSACTTDASTYEVIRLLKERFQDPPELPVTRQDINEYPYAIVSARFGRAMPAVLILVADEPRGQQWMATDNISIVTRAGRLVRTVGFNIDMLDTYVPEDIDPLADDPQLLTDIVRYQRIVMADGQPPYLYFLDCKMTPKGPEVITIIEIDFQVMRLEEKCDTKGWDFKNTYWVDPFDGFVWQSIEHFADGMQALKISVLKPAG